nr:hypothetical protein [Anaerolineae bacterium]
RSGYDKQQYLQLVNQQSQIKGELKKIFLKDMCDHPTKKNTHAEDELLLEFMISKSDQINQQKGNTLVMILSKSPCKACREKLIGFSKNYLKNSGIKMNILYQEVYLHWKNEHQESPSLASLANYNIFTKQIGSYDQLDKNYK